MTAQTLFNQQAVTDALAADISPYTMGMAVSLSQDAPLTGIWFYSGVSAAVLPDQCGIFNTSGTLITFDATPVWSGIAGSGWVRCQFNGSTTLIGNTDYIVAVHGSGGSNWYTATHHYWDTGPGASGLISGVINGLSNSQAVTAGVAGQDSFTSGGSTLVMVNSTFQASNYWIDVEVDVAAAVVSLGSSSISSKDSNSVQTKGSVIVSTSISGASTRSNISGRL